MANRVRAHSFQTKKGIYKNETMYPLYEDFVKSRAFKSLSPNALKVYIYLYTKYKAKLDGKHVVGGNHKDISFTKDEIALRRKQGYALPSHKTCLAALDELIDKGFLRVVKSGYATKTCNIYELYHKWNDPNYVPKEEYKRLSRRNY